MSNTRQVETCSWCYEKFASVTLLTAHQSREHSALPDEQALNHLREADAVPGDSALGAILGFVVEKPLWALIPLVLILGLIFTITNALGITDTTAETETTAEPARQAADARSAGLDQSPVSNDPESLDNVRHFLYVNSLCSTTACPQVLAAGPSVFSFYVDVSSAMSPLAACDVLLLFATDDVVVHQNGVRAAEGDPKDGQCHLE